MREIYNSTIDEVFLTQELANGLSVYIMPRPQYKRQYALLAANCGSIDLNFLEPDSEKMIKVPSGIAHFLEHKLFEDKEKNIFDRFASLGSSANAYTGFSSTSYLFSSTNNFKEALLNLLDFVQSPYFTEENVEKEKGIIAQEIKMYEDDPGWQAFFNFLQGLYQKFPVRFGIAGTVESIKEITSEDLYNFYNTFYHPSNMVLFLTGNLNPQEILKVVKDNQFQKNYSPRGDIERIFPEEASKVNYDKKEVEMDVSRPIFNLGFKEINLEESGRDLIKQEILTNMLLEMIIGKGSNLYYSLYEEGLLDDNFSLNYNLEPDYGFVRFSGETDNPEKLFDKIFHGVQAVKKDMLVENFSRMNKKYKGEFISAFNTFEFIASEFVSFYFRGVNLLAGLDIMEEITPEDLIQQYEQIFDFERAVKSIVNPV